MRKTSYFTKAQADMQYLLVTESPLYCDYCKKPLGILHSVRYALFKKKGSVYLIPCKKCGELNKRIKGKLKEELNKRWE